jgi:hypothetical protein
MRSFRAWIASDEAVDVGRHYQKVAKAARTGVPVKLVVRSDDVK